jgi:lipopolysaccharide transport system permease protein
MFFSTAVVTSGNSVVASAHLITKVYFPRLIVPISAICGRFVDFAISSLVLAVLLFYYRVEGELENRNRPPFGFAARGVGFWRGRLKPQPGT